MSCNNRLDYSEERYINQQEHRDINRLWGRAIQKMSTTRMNMGQNFMQDSENEGEKRMVRFGNQGFNEPADPGSCAEIKLPSEAVQKKLAKGKAMVKKKSPLQKFDEIVTKELTIRRMAEEERMPSFDGSRKWSNIQFSGSKMSDFGRNKISIEGKVSRGALHGVEMEVKEGELSDAQNEALLDAIDKLAQAQAFCRFDAAVKAAEAATASVPPEMAEEVAVACAKDYQSEVVDIINEKMLLAEEKKPMEVIGYIGVTKYKENQ